MAGAQARDHQQRASLSGWKPDSQYGPLPPLKLRAGKILAATGSDKKNVGGVRRFVLPIGIGDAGVVEDVTPAELEAAVGYMLASALEKTGAHGSQRGSRRG